MQKIDRQAGRRVRGLALILAMALALAGCNLFGGEDGGEDAGRDDDGEQVARGGSIAIEFINFPTLDPQVVTNGMWLAAMGLLEPLVVQNEDGTDVIPGTADTWEVSEDGTVYTLHIRDDAAWSNGDPVTAEDFVWTYQRLLDPQAQEAGVTYGVNSYQTTLGITGAAGYLAGTLEDWSQVGIEAVGEDELRFTLDQPNPVFLFGLTHPSMLPLHPGTVQEEPDDWQTPENWVGNGPFVPSAWAVNSSMTLRPNPEYWDEANVYLDEITVQLVEASGASAVAYENGEIDVMAIGAADVTRFANSSELEEHVHRVPGTTVAYLAVLRSENPALQDVRVREALALGLDRETIARVEPAAEAGPSLVPSTVPDWDESVAVTFDPARAKQLLTEAGYPDGEGFPTINILSGSSVPLLDAIVDQWQEDLGIQVQSDVVEVGEYVDTRDDVWPADHTGFYIGYFGMQPNWTYVTTTVWGPPVIQQFSLPPGSWLEYQQILTDEAIPPAEQTAQLGAVLERDGSATAKEFADLVQQASTAVEESDRTALYREAAAVRQSTYLFVPVAWLDSIYAVRPTVTGVNLRPTLDFFYLKGVGLSS